MCCSFFDVRTFFIDHTIFKYICMTDVSRLSTSYNIIEKKNVVLTAQNWQKWKIVFPTCLCHEIYRDEAVGLKSCKYTWKCTIYVNMWIFWAYPKQRKGVNVADENVNVVPHHDAISLHCRKFTLNTKIEYLNTFAPKCRRKNVNLLRLCTPKRCRM